MYGLPLNVLKFAINAFIDSLPSYTNIFRWNKRLNDKCPHCPHTRGTLHHILSFCPTLLERYTWRHNSILMKIFKILNTSPNDYKIYMDIEGHTIAGTTVPPHILPTTQKPDMTIIWEEKKQICLIQLTVPFETNLEIAHTWKLDRYATLGNDLEGCGWKVIYDLIEIGAWGLVTKENKSCLMNLVKLCNCDTKKNDFILHDSQQKYYFIIICHIL